MHSVAADGCVNRNNSTSLEGKLGESSYTFCLGFLTGAGSSFLFLSGGNIAVVVGSRGKLGYGWPYAPYISLTSPRPSNKSRLSQSPSSLYATGTTFQRTHPLPPRRPRTYRHGAMSRVEQAMTTATSTWTHSSAAYQRTHPPDSRLPAYAWNVTRTQDSHASDPSQATASHGACHAVPSRKAIYSPFLSLS